MSPTLCLIISGFFFAIIHACVKLLPRIPPYELVFFRCIISAAITFGALRINKISPWGNNKPMLVLRGVFGTAALLMYFHTLQSMPMSSAVTIQYLHPIITVVFASLFLREKATVAQWFLLAASFIGVLLVRGFDSRISGIDVGIGVLSALCSACAYTLIRALRHQDHPLVVVFFFPFIGLVLLGPYTLSHWIQPTQTEWMIMITIGLFTQAAQYLMTLAYQKETAANISNINYLGIAYALVIGLVWFGETAEPLALCGMLVIVLSAYIGTRTQRAVTPIKVLKDTE